MAPGIEDGGCAMKFSSAQPQFTPIQMLLESPEEVAAVFALLDHATVSAAVGLSGMEGAPWEALKAANEAAGNPEIDYERRYEALEELLR